ncbi:MAG: GSCFA domain-containing protein [Muribaculaceae bacterium]|nr:GSCFA domain-containing protein [Muribaculaceae bacterium]
MKFRTELIPAKPSFVLNPERAVVLLGSCFTDNIGRMMRCSRWRAFPNVCGTLFNPASIANILRIALYDQNIYSTIRRSVAERDNRYVSWLTDSCATTYSKAETEERVFSRFLRLMTYLSEAETLIITFGTAWVYELCERPGYIVSNCHKFPAEMFMRRRLTLKEITEEWNILLERLRQIYPKLKVIFTVSPVRHLKDGFEGNSCSKAILQLACEEICMANDQAVYFPAFEIMNDDLRDYRFYAEDLVHPSEEGIEYIWEKFKATFLTEASRQLLKEGEKVSKRLNHRPIVYGESDLARYVASTEESKAMEFYNKFMKSHPSMLPLDE